MNLHPAKPVSTFVLSSMPSLTHLSQNVFLLMIMIISMIFTTKSLSPSYLDSSKCNTNTTTTSSTYLKNLNTVFSYLVSNATHHEGFYTTSSGSINSNSTVYGLLLCRGDLSSADCQTCVQTAVEFLSKNCSRRKEALVWYDLCMVRFSDTTLFGQLDTSMNLGLVNTQNTMGNMTGFEQVVASTMTGLQSIVANGGSTKKFATKEAPVPGEQPVYLSVPDCSTCLNGGIQLLFSCCSGRQGARVLYPSCNVRYEIYQFYEAQAPAPAPLTEAPPVASPPSELASKNATITPSGKNGSAGKLLITIILLAIAAILLVGLIGFCYTARRKKQQLLPEDETESASNDFTTVESLQYDLGTLQAATNCFSVENKIGSGGFGSVYMGISPNGQEIAIKRLSRSSGQGAEEFKNEALLVAKLQHRNLARVLGFCLAGDEKLLVYEFVPNRSLDHFLFDPDKRCELDWSRRYKIILGVAKGMLYLHEDSQLRIIHRDLKASNVLLDGDMNPKISDFGMARIVGVDHSQANTSRVVGTLRSPTPFWLPFPYERGNDQ